MDILKRSQSKTIQTDNDIAFCRYTGTCICKMLNGHPSYAATSTSTPVAQRPKLNGHRNSTDTIPRTKILLLGLRRSGFKRSVRSFHEYNEFIFRAGKTSIQQVLFNDLSPKQTFYLETTMRIVKHTFECVRLRL